MCGVVAIFSYGDGSVDRAELTAVRDAMVSRGPDGFGSWYAEDGRVGLGHRRLAIIDLNERAAQPMLSVDGQRVITFNGEIYNYQALRDTLTAAGHRFRSTSDTEVLLALYAEHGERMTEQLRGMYAFAIWDARAGAMFLARDPYGIKPLYVADDGRTLRVASQVRALLAGGRVSRERDPAGMVGYFTFGSVPEPYTRYRAIRAFPPGHSAWVRAGTGLEPARAFFSLAGVLERGVREPRQLTATDLGEAVRDAVRHHLVADVPVGAFLSSGVDSGALVALMSELSDTPIHTITLAFAEFRGQARDEAPLAERLAQRYHTAHTTRVVTRGDFTAAADDVVAAMDQPSIDGINTWLVCRVARESGLKVAVSGLGGDELFGGYATFREVPILARWLAPFARFPTLAEAFRQLLLAPWLPTLPFARLQSPKFAGLLQYGSSYAGAYLLRRGLFMPWELSALLPPDELEEGLRTFSPMAHIEGTLVPDPGEPFARVAAMEGSLYMRNQLLRDSDWASMAHGVELRVPLVDSVLLTTLAPMLTAGNIDGKALLASSPKRPLPDEVVKRRKTGFSIPIHYWVEQGIAGLDSWRGVPLLADERCHWARRLAYALDQLDR